MNDHDTYRLRHEITNLTEGLAGDHQDLAILRQQVGRAEQRIFHKQNRLRELRDQLKGTQP